MKLAWFGVEEWLNPMDSLARINLGSSCVSALRMDELFDLTGEDLDAFLNEMRTMSLHYHHGDATGSPRIKAAVAGIYPKGNVKPEEVMITHGGTGANDLVLMSVLEPAKVLHWMLMEKNTGYSATNGVISAEKKPMAMAAAAVMHGDSRRISTWNTWGTMTESMTPTT